MTESQAEMIDLEKRIVEYSEKTGYICELTYIPEVVTEDYGWPVSRWKFHAYRPNYSPYYEEYGKLEGEGSTAEEALRCIS